MSIPEIREYLKTHTYYQYETHEALLAISAKVSQRDETKVYSSRMNTIRHLWMMVQSHIIVYSEL